MNMLVSVIVPVYNVEQYLPSCIESIICQDYSNIEVIIINDGSTDKSFEIAKIYAEKDQRIKVFSQLNAGLSAARNAGVVKSKGDYILFVDSDDFISHNMVSRFLKVSELTGADYVCSESENFVGGNEKFAKKCINSYNEEDIPYELLEKKDALIGMFYQKPSITGAYLKLYKKELIDGIPFPEGRYFEDLATTYKYIEKSSCIAFIKEKHYAYRIRTNSIMNQKFSVRKMDCVWVSDIIEKDLAKSNEAIRKAMACGIFRLNRIAYMQTPIGSKYSRIIFINIKKYRKRVLLDTNAKLYERLLAFFSYCGKAVFRTSLYFFSLLRLISIFLKGRIVKGMIL